MDQKALFRKAALDKLASPERLDVMIKVTSPFGWLAMATVGMVLVGVIVWSILGAIPTRVAGTGILAAGTTLNINAPAAGPLTRLAVSEGDQVEAGQLIAQIELKGDQRDYENAKDRFSRRETNYQNVRADVNRSHRDIDRQIGDVQSLISGVESEITRLQARLGDPKYSTNKTNREIAQHRQTIASYTGQITSMRSQKDGGNQRVAQARNSMEEARAEMESYADMLGGDGKIEITTRVAGRVVEVVAVQDATLKAGDPIVRVMEGFESGLKARFYVGAANAVTITEGMVVEISPAGIKKEEYGFLRAKVLSRSDQALTLAALQKEIPPEGLRQEIMDSQGQAVYRIDAEIDECETPTGFCWSSGAGPIGGLSGNMKLEVNVITDSRKPYTLVIPKVKKTVGLS